ncbi:MAG: serine hydrolase domain-containing protein [Woeseiaceae bacterium]
MRVVRMAVMVLLGAIAGCAAPLPEGPDQTLLANLAKAQERPTSIEMEWRQPKAKVAGASGNSRSVVPASFPSQEGLKRAQAYSEEHAGKGFMVWHEGQLVASAFSSGVDQNTHFASYSMHKSVLAIVILAAIEDGIIGSLDDGVGGHIREWRNDPRGDITYRQLLTHTSGLKHYGFQDAPAQNINLSSRIREAALAFPQDKTPGSHFQYSNVNSLIAGIALSGALKKVRKTYQGYLSERLWQPLGNQDAALWLDRENGINRFQSGLEAGLGDWLNVGIMLANGGKFDGRQILRPESIAALVTPSEANPAYGLHLWLGDAWEPARSYGPGTAAKVIHSAPYLAKRVWFFDGFGGQRVYVLPDQQMVVARFGEVDFSYDDAAIVNILLRSLLDEKAAAALATYADPASDDVYQQRFDELMAAAQLGVGLPGYDPLIPLPGAPNAEVLPTGSAEWLDAPMQQTLRQFASETNTSAIKIWHQDQVVFSTFGADVDEQTEIISRSLSKPLSVVAVGRAIERGYIQSLDQPAADFIVDWQDTPKAAITIRQLLQMRSGLAAQGGSRDPDDVMNRAYLHPFHTEVIVKEYPLTNVPGSRYDYSNANAEMIAPILERATGRLYEDWLTEAVLEPIDAPGGSIWVNRLGGTTHSGCCAQLPADVYMRLSLLILRDGIWEGERLLPEGFVSAMTTPTSDYPYAAMGVYVAGKYTERRGHANPEVPYGKVLHSEPYLANDLFLFDGNGNQVSYIIPSHDLIIMRLGKTPPKGAEWDNPKLPNMILRALAAHSGVTLSPQAL